MKEERYVVRLGDIPFSKQFVRSLKLHGIIISRRSEFGRSAIMINHGNHNPIKIKPNVREFILINKPEAIRYCSNKRRNFEILKEFYPETYDRIGDVKSFPVVVKPLHGHHGLGIKKIESKKELEQYARTHDMSNHLIQKYVKMKFEYRFNILDKEIFQISKKELIEGFCKGGFEFAFKSLGDKAQLSPKFYNFVKDVIDTFHKRIGYDLGSYCVDVMKGTDGKYYLSELNSGYGIGQFTIEKLVKLLNKKYRKGDLNKYRVR